MSKESRKRALGRKWLREEKKMCLLDAIKEEKRIRNSLSNYGVADFKFCKGIVRMMTDGRLSPDEATELNEYLVIVGSDAHAEEYDADLNGMTFGEIKERFATQKEYKLDEDIERSKSVERKRNESYKIIKVDDYETAHLYQRYTTWCVTGSEGMYENYTDNGIGRFFFCLKDGFENVDEKQGENTPLDEYGLSMIAVSVGIDGAAKTITCRWNHGNGGNDHVMKVEQLEELLGMSFYEAFPPYTREELHKKGKYMLDDIGDMLKEGHTFDELGVSVLTDKSDSERFKVVTLYGRMNVYDTTTNEIMFKTWFSKLAVTNNGMAIGEKYGESNIYYMAETEEHHIGDAALKKGKYEFKEYSEGFVVVVDPESKKENLLNVDTLSLLSPDEWFKEAQPMNNGFSIVQGWDDDTNELVWNLLYSDGHWARTE